jgi:hypothetical protein
MLKFARWDQDDTITRDPLRMWDDVITRDDAISIGAPLTGRIFMTSGMNIMTMGLFNFLRSKKNQSNGFFKWVRWKDDAITHGPLPCVVISRT